MALDTNEFAQDVAFLLKKHNCRAIVAAFFTQPGEVEQVLNVVAPNVDPAVFSLIRLGLEDCIQFYTGSATIDTERGYLKPKKPNDEMPF